MADYTNINVTVEGGNILAQNVNVTQTAKQTPAYALGYRYPLGNIPNGISNNISIDYIMEPNTDRNFDSIQSWKRNYFVSNINLALNIGGVDMDAYLFGYNFSIVPNSLIIAKAQYVVFGDITGIISENSFENLSAANLENSIGVGHYSTATFTKNGVDVFDHDLISLDYSFDANTLPTFNIKDIIPTQINIINSTETVSITTKTQKNTNFSGKFLGDVFSTVDSINLRNLDSESFHTYQTLDLSDFVLDSTRFDIKEQNLLLFTNTFKCYN